MKKIVLVFISLLMLSYYANAEIIVYQYETCGPGTPHPNGPATYEYIYHHADQVVHITDYLQVRTKSVSCEDPGDNGCTCSMVIPGFNEHDILTHVGQKVALGFPSGEENPDGTSGDNDPYNQDLQAHPYYTWEPSPAGCTIIKVYFDDGL